MTLEVSGTSAPEPLVEHGPPAPKPAARLDSVDLLRGVVMVLMVLDHTRDFFAAPGDPTDLSTTTPALFMTRWVTHFCAPVFAFLAGTGAALAGARGTGRRELARFLVTRGFWLIFLEETAVKFGLMFNPAPTFFLGTVLWSIGGSFVLLAGLVALGLSRRAVGLIGLAVIVANNLLAGRLPTDLTGPLRVLMGLFIQRGLIGNPASGVFALIAYPLLPWFGVVAAGYGFGEILGWEPARRRRTTLLLGLGMTAAFVVLRWWNVFGDPSPWSTQARPGFTLLSFLNCTKYLPSLLFLFMTLGPALVALSVFDRGAGAVGRPFVTLGRVPLFYFILQWYVIHLLALLVALVRVVVPVLVDQPAGIHLLSLVVARVREAPLLWLFSVPAPPPECSYSLPVVYLAWAVVVAILYVASRWFAGVKQRHRDVRWLSYL
jgi:uncharacterized membrane protein